MKKDILQKKQASKNFFNFWAKSYDSFIFKRWMWYVQDQVIKQIEMKQGRILDIGCGTGYLLHELSGNKFDLYGIDFSQEMLKKAKAKLSKRANLISGDAENLPFKDNYFDFVCCVEVLHHLPDPIKVLHEINRILKKKGSLIIADINFPPVTLTNLVARFEPGFIKQYSKKEMKKIFEKTGFVVTKQNRTAFFAILTKGKK